MTLELALYIISGLGILLSVLWTLVLLFAKAWVKNFSVGVNEKFLIINKTIETSNENIRELLNKMIKQETEILAEKQACVNTHKSIEMKFKRYDFKIDKHESRLDNVERKTAVIETKIENK